MNPRGSLPEKILALREALLPCRQTGVTLDAHAVSIICATLAICGVEAEQLLLDRDRLLEALDSKVTSLSRFRRERSVDPGPTGGSAA